MLSISFMSRVRVGGLRFKPFPLLVCKAISAKHAPLSRDIPGSPPLQPRATRSVDESKKEEKIEKSDEGRVFKACAKMIVLLSNDRRRMRTAE